MNRQELKRFDSALTMVHVRPEGQGDGRKASRNLRNHSHTLYFYNYAYSCNIIKNTKNSFIKLDMLPTGRSVDTHLLGSVGRSDYFLMLVLMFAIIKHVHKH